MRSQSCVGGVKNTKGCPSYPMHSTYDPTGRPGVTTQAVQFFGSGKPHVGIGTGWPWLISQPVLRGARWSRRCQLLLNSVIKLLFRCYRTDQPIRPVTMVGVEAVVVMIALLRIVLGTIY